MIRLVSTIASSFQIIMSLSCCCFLTFNPIFGWSDDDSACYTISLENRMKFEYLATITLNFNFSKFTS